MATDVGLTSITITQWEVSPVLGGENKQRGLGALSFAKVGHVVVSSSSWFPTLTLMDLTQYQLLSELCSHLHLPAGPIPSKNQDGLIKDALSS